MTKKQQILKILFMNMFIIGMNAQLTEQERIERNIMLRQEKLVKKIEDWDKYIEDKKRIMIEHVLKQYTNICMSTLKQNLGLLINNIENGLLLLSDDDISCHGLYVIGEMECENFFEDVYKPLLIELGKKYYIYNELSRKDYSALFQTVGIEYDDVSNSNSALI